MDFKEQNILNNIFQEFQNIQDVKADAKYLKDDALFLYNKANDLKTSGHIEIANYFSKDNDGKYSNGVGVIETMKLDGANIDVSHLDAIRSQVATFLSTTSYASAYECLDKCADAETLAGLINAYTYHPNA